MLWQELLLVMHLHWWAKRGVSAVWLRERAMRGYQIMVVHGVSYRQLLLRLALARGRNRDPIRRDAQYRRPMRLDD